MHFRISAWVGRLGNHLIQLSNAIYTAQHYNAHLEVPNHELLGSMKFDFSGEKPKTTDALVSTFFWPHECFGVPIRHDAIRGNILRQFVLPLFENKMRASFLRIFARNDVTEDTLVINMRSGSDIFTPNPPPQADYMQPPLSFYQSVIKSGNYKKCLIVTEKDQKNPVIRALTERNPQIVLNQHRSVLDDVRLILSATHLVLAHSTFTWCLALMSRRLQVLHQPATILIKGIPWIKITTWNIDDYIKPGEWTASHEQMLLMVNHSISKVSSVTELPDYLPPSAFGVTNDPAQLEAIEASKREMAKKMEGQLMAKLNGPVT